MEDTQNMYHKIFDALLVLRDVAAEFKIYSAADIKALIAAKLKAKKREPKGLQSLYELETMIRIIRESFIIAKTEAIIDARENEKNKEDEGNKKII
jgi:hypothetical protein